MPITKECIVCGTKFTCKPSHIIRAKYCSKSCRSKNCGFQKGAKPANYGKTSWAKDKIFSIEHRQNISNARKGIKILPHQGFQPNNKCYLKRNKNYKGSNNPNWKNGLWVKQDGYVLIHMPNHPNANGRKYINRSHLVMEKHIKRFLKKTEIVHHINKIRNDDRIDNLHLFKSNSEHTKFHRSNPL